MTVASFIIVVNNSDEIPVSTGTVTVRVLVQFNGEEIQSTCTKNSDGTWKGAYTPKEGGGHTVEVKVDGAMVSGSPFYVLVSPKF